MGSNTVTVFVAPSPTIIDPIVSVYAPAAPEYFDILAHALDRLCEYARSGDEVTAEEFAVLLGTEF